MARPLRGGSVTGDRRKPTQGERQRQAIVDAVRDLVIEHSIDELTISQIAAKAGVSRQGFYVYFDNKYAALAVALVEAVEELRDAVEQVGNRSGGETIDDYLLRLLGAAVVVNTRHISVVTAAMRAGSEDPQLREMTENMLTGTVEQLSALLSAGDNPPTAVHADSVLRMLVGMTIAAGQHVGLLLVDPAGPERGMDAMVHIWKHALWPDL